MIAKKTQLILAALNLAAFLFGAVFFAQFDFAPFSLNVHPAVDLLVLSIGFFVLSILFKGYLTPAIFLYFGLTSSSIFLTNPIGVVLSSVPLLVASYGGSLTGYYTDKDLDEKQNLFEHKKEILIIFFASLLLAIIAGFLFEFF